MTRSLWLETTADLALPPLTEDVEADVCVIGAGIFGMSAALLLAEARRSVVVVEADRVGSGVSGTTTAKVSVLQGTTLHALASRFGEEGARVYAEANTAGLELVRRWVEENGIACDLRRRPAVTYALDESGLPELEAEAKAGQRAALDVRLVDAVDLPYPVAGAVVLDDQAELHPRRYLLGLAAELRARGGRIFEHTRATGVHEGAPCRVESAAGTVTCADVVVATHYPILDRGLYFARLSPQRSYAIAARVDGPLPYGMFISSDTPTRSLRAHPMEDGSEILIVGGEGHKTGQHDAPTAERYAALERWAREHFAVRSVDYRWSAQDPSSADGLPYVGRYGPTSRHLWVGTAFNKWGLTNGGAAALMVADRILGRESAWLETFDANRARPLAAGPTLLKENLNVGARFVRDRLRRPDYDSVADVAPGRGGVVLVDGRRVGVFRREDGGVDAVSVACTHLGCHVRFNDAERTWDCPCHGSRFDTTGRVLEGPAVKDLERRELAQSTGS